MDELKRCPFCGGKSQVTENYLNDDFVSIDGFIAFCTKCGNSTDTHCLKKDAIKYWNRRADGWIPCSEMLPESGVLVFTHYKGKAGIFGNRYYKDTKSWIYGDVTHWMPLPQPPKDGE